MRTTLTLEDDLAEALKARAHAMRKPFKQVVNEVIRRGLTIGAAPSEPADTFRVEPEACGFKPGVDIGKLNQYVDETELEGFGEATVHDGESSAGDEQIE